MAGFKRFEQSPEFKPSPPGQPVEWLKAKYREHKPISKGKSSPGGRSGAKKRDKIASRNHGTPRKVVLVLLPSGKKRFRDYREDGNYA